jgi:hypothetical protein
MNAIKREEAMFSMMTDQDIEREASIKAYRKSGQHIQDCAGEGTAWVEAFYQQEVLAGNEPGPDAEDEKMYKRQEGGE